MFAWFYEGKFQTFRQDQRMENYVEVTAQALGQNPAHVEIFIAPPIRNDQSYYFNDEKKLVLGVKREETVGEGEQAKVITVTDWGEPIELVKFFPKPQY